MVEFTEWQIFILSAIIGFVVALGFKYATVSKDWDDKRAVTSQIISNAVLGAIYGVVVCAIAFLLEMNIVIEYMAVFSYIFITVASGESITKLLEQKVGQGLRIWLGFADEDEKDGIIRELRASNEILNDKLKQYSNPNGGWKEVEIDLPSEEPKPECPIPEPLIDANNTEAPMDTTTMDGVPDEEIETI